MDEKLARLKKNYEATPIPEELHSMMAQVVIQNRAKKRKHPAVRFAGVAGAAVICLSVLVNVNSSAYEAMAAVPLLGSLVEVISFREFTAQNGTSQLDVTVPSVIGLEYNELQKELNEKFLDNGQAVAAAYEQDLKEIQKNLGERENVNYAAISNYETLVNDERVLTIAITTTWTQASSMEQTAYYTVDKLSGRLLVLADLFVEGSDWEEKIRGIVLTQMAAEMTEDEGKTYFTDQVDQVEPAFYIDSSRQLMLAYDEYQVAPGYMGSPVFTIAKEEVSDVLSEVSDQLLK